MTSKDAPILPTQEEWNNLRDSYLGVVNNFYEAFQHHNRSGALVHDILNKSQQLRFKLTSLDDLYSKCTESNFQLIVLWTHYKNQLIKEIGTLAEMVGRTYQV